jgi:hypothetical protein
MTMRIGRVLAVVALLNFAGAHWIVLQSIAWSSMMAKQARYSHLAEAVQKTFDGAHPCDLCKGISRAQEKERKPAVPVEFSKLPLLHEFVPKFVSILRISIVGTRASQFLLTRCDQPEFPPPRVRLSV